MAESLNTLLSPINLLVARGNNWQPRVTNEGSSMIWSFPSPTISKTLQNMAYPLTYWLLGATIGNQGSLIMNLQCSEVFPHKQ